MLGIGHAIGQKWVYDQHYGCRWPSASTTTSRPRFWSPVNMQWAALDIPDPETPVGARGIGEPPVGGGCAAILNALSDALGDEVFRRAPVTADMILASLEAGRPMQTAQATLATAQHALTQRWRDRRNEENGIWQ